MSRLTSYTSLPRWLRMRVNADFVAGIVWTKSTSGNPGWQAPRWNIGCIFVHFCKLTINRRASLQQWLKPRDKKNVYISSAVQMSTWSWKISICLLWLHFLETFAVGDLLEMVDDLEDKILLDHERTPLQPFSSKRRLFPYVYRSFHLLWPITISLFVSE